MFVGLFIPPPCLFPHPPSPPCACISSLKPEYSWPGCRQNHCTGELYAVCLPTYHNGVVCVFPHGFPYISYVGSKHNLKYSTHMSEISGFCKENHYVGCSLVFIRILEWSCNIQVMEKDVCKNIFPVKHRNSIAWIILYSSSSWYRNRALTGQWTD